MGKASASALQDVDLEIFHAAVQHLEGFETLLRFDLSAPAISSLADEIISRSRQIADAVAAVPVSERSAANVLDPLLEWDRSRSPISQCVRFPRQVHVDKEIRDASARAQKKLDAYSGKGSDIFSGRSPEVYGTLLVEGDMRVDVFEAVLSLEPMASQLDPERKRALEFIIRDYRRNGLDLDQTKRDRVASIQKEMSDLKIEFQRNLAEENTTILFSREELEGLPDSFLRNLPRSEEKFVLRMERTQVFPVLRLCSVSDTRRRLQFLFDSRCKKENTPILERLVSLRDEQAKLLGYKDHAHYVLALRM
jgi:Zn-dependent oligopeptidase